MRYKSDKIKEKTILFKVAEKTNKYSEMYNEIRVYKQLASRKFFDDQTTVRGVVC